LKVITDDGISDIISLCDSDKISKNTNLTVNNLNNKELHTIIILGDSYIRGCAESAKDNLDETCIVTGIVKSGASVTTPSDSIKDTISTLGKKDILVFCGGSKDISRNNSRKRLRYISNFVGKYAHTNIVSLNIPHRYDLANWSCVNKKINIFNRKMHKIMKCYDHVTELSSELNRKLFTRYGMHLNKRGKAEIANHITEACKQIVQPKRKHVPNFFTLEGNRKS
jgi:hypothetical protein